MDDALTTNEAPDIACVQCGLFAVIRQMADAGESEASIRALTGASRHEIHAALEQGHVDSPQSDWSDSERDS